jgi:putative ABC transport system permease protein
MLRASLKGVWAHKLRLALTALAIVLGVGFVSGTYIYTDTIGSAFDGIFADAFEGIDIVISAESDFQFGEGVFIDESDLDRIDQVEGVESFETYIQGLGVAILDKDGDPIGGQGPPQFGASLVESTNETGGFSLREGGYPVGGDQIVLDAGSASVGEYEVGDTVSIVTEVGGEQGFELVGIAGFGDLDNLGGATFALFDLETAQDVLGRPGVLTSGVVQVTPGVDVDTVITSIEETMPENITVLSGQSAAEADAGEIQEGLAFFGIFLSTFGYIALFVGTFIIANTFRIIVTQRTKELALLRILGATARQVFQMMLFEAIVVGVFASAVGIIFGLGVATLLQTILAAIGIDLPTTSLSLQPRTIVVGMLVGVIVTLVSATLPARRAARVPPAAALRDDTAGSPRKALTLRAKVGATILGLGLIVLFTGLYGSFESGPPEIAYVGLGAATIFIGVSVISPLFARPIVRGIGRVNSLIRPVGQWVARAFSQRAWLRWLLWLALPMWLFRRWRPWRHDWTPRESDLPFTLAEENAIRTPRRTSATAAALMIGITLVTLAATMAASIRGTVDDILGNSIAADLIVRPTNAFDPTAGFTPEIAETIAASPDVEDLTRVQFGSVLIDGAETFIYGVEEDYSAYFPPDSSEGTLNPGPDEVVVEQSIAESNQWVIGSTIELVFEASGAQHFTLVGTADGDAWDDVIAISQAEWSENYGVEVSDAQLLVRAVDGVTPEDLAASVTLLIDDVPTVQAQTLEELQNEVADQINGLLNIITGLLGLAIVIALLGVTNTMTLSVFERTREIGLLRAIGLQRIETRWMIRSEASIIAVFGAVLGVVIGVFFGWAIIQALSDEGFSSFVVPFQSIVVWIAITGFLGIVFASLPAWRASKLNVLEAISYE